MSLPCSPASRRTVEMLVLAALSLLLMLEGGGATSVARLVINSGGANASYLAGHGFTHQVVGSVEVLASYRWLNEAVFPPGSARDAWRLTMAARERQDHSQLRAAGLQVITGMDIFVVPEPLFALYAANMTDPASPSGIEGFGSAGGDRKRITLNNFTLWLMAGMLDEVFDMFPDLDGVMVRVGENYGGPSAPFTWVGNGAVDFLQPFAVQQQQYRSFINALRDIVCVKHNKTLIFRTWDTSGFSPKAPARFHPSLEYYLNVTDLVDPHPNLIFSIKHVALDFWRWVRFNPSLTRGRHQQVVEVECQREYEGKGAFPNYIAQGVIDGFSEFGAKAVGLRHVVEDSLIVGIWMWSSGGGWNGPVVSGQLLWPHLNTMVIAQWYLNAIGATGESEATDGNVVSSEQSAFLQHCIRETAKGNALACSILHNISILSQDAVLATRYVAAYDGWLPGQTCGTVSCMPSNNWLRDDRMIGLQWLGRAEGGYGNPGVIYWLHNNSKSDDALAEKSAAVEIWDSLIALAQQLPETASVRAEVLAGALYGRDLAVIIRWGWEAMVWGYRGDQAGGQYNHTALATAIANYDLAWAAYNRTLATQPLAATPFHDFYEGGSEMSRYVPGIGASIDVYRGK